MSITSLSIGVDDDSKPLIIPPKNGKLCFCIPLDWIVLPPEGHEVKIKNSALSTLFLLLNTMIGSGILVQAYVFRETGVVAAIIEYIIITIMIYFGVSLTVKVADHTQLLDYSKLANVVLGDVYGIIADLSIFINNAGALLSYILIIGSLLGNVIQTFSSCSLWLCNIGFLTAMPILWFTVPLCLIRNFGHLAIISYVSIFVISASMLLVIIGGPVEHAKSDDDAAVKVGSFLGSITSIGDIVFALGYITAIFHSYHALEDKSVTKFNNIALETTVLGSLMCFFTGLAGYLSFGDGTDTNILDNFPGVVGAIFKVAVVLHLILYIPGDFVIMRAALFRIFKVEVATQSDFSFVVSTLGCILTITVIGVLLQIYCRSSNNLSIVINITGGVGGSLLYFIIPALETIALFKDDQNLLYKCYGLLAFGIAILVLVIVGTVI